MDNWIYTHYLWSCQRSAVVQCCPKVRVLVRAPRGHLHALLIRGLWLTTSCLKRQWLETWLRGNVRCRRHCQLAKKVFWLSTRYLIALIRISLICSVFHSKFYLEKTSEAHNKHFQPLWSLCNHPSVFIMKPIICLV